MLWFILCSLFANAAAQSVAGLRPHHRHTRQFPLVEGPGACSVQAGDNRLSFTERYGSSLPGCRSAPFVWHAVQTTSAVITHWSARCPPVAVFNCWRPIVAAADARLRPQPTTGWGQIKWHHFTFLLVANECINKILWFLAHINYIMQKMRWCKDYVIMSTLIRQRALQTWVLSICIIAVLLSLNF